MTNPVELENASLDHRKFERIVSFERGETINLETGEFPMVLATDGEASDGDILSIPGARYSDRHPLQNSHINNIRETLGSITHLRRDLQSNPKKLRALGQIELGGPNAMIRQDLAYMIGQGHLRSVSVSWNPIKWRKRLDLPEGHPFRVLENEKDPRKRYGYHHDEWVVNEASLVAVPADKQAIIGRVDELDSGPVREFWRSVAETIPSEEPPQVTPEARLAAFAAQIREFLQSGIPLEDLASILDEHKPPPAPPAPEWTLEELVQRITELEVRLQGPVQSREPAVPAPAIGPSDFAKALRAALEEVRTESADKYTQKLKELRGKL